MMNNSDFLSDAVALDLGKSGVKVAETLEIQVGEEWWRLINAADVSTVRAYQGRRHPSPVIVGGELNLTTYTNQVSLASGSTYNKPTTTDQPFTGIAFTDDMSPLYYTIHHERGTSAYFIATLFNANGTFIKTIQGYNTSAAIVGYGTFWDNVNKRIMVTYYNPSRTDHLYATITANAFSFAIGATYNVSTSGYTQPKVFPEQPNSIYTLFKQNGALLVKRTNPTLGQSASSVGNSVCNFSGATNITVASNYNFEQKEADLFYSRTHESVGVAWVDTGTRYLYYALESENWETVHLLSQETAKPYIYLHSFGNLVLPSQLEEGGEYYVANLRKQENDNIKLPTGYSFPSNLSVISACAGTSNDFRILGNVGPNLYMYCVNYANMTITKTPSNPVALSFTPEVSNSTSEWSYEIVKVGESGNRELFFLQNYGLARVNVDTRAALLFCYDKNIGEILWIWGNSEWSSSSIFPNTYSNPGSSWSNWKQQILQKVENYIGIIQGRCANISIIQMEYYWVSLPSILACNDSMEVTALLTNRKYQNIYSLQESPCGACPIRPLSWQNVSITWDVVLNMYCFVLSPHTHQESRIFYVNKDTMTFAAISNAVSPTFVSSTGIRFSSGAALYLPDERRYCFNFSGVDEGVDAYIRYSRNTSTTYLVGQSNVAQATINNMGGGIPWVVSLNKPDLLYYPSAASNTVYLSGGSINNCTTQRRFTIPHTFYKYMVSEFDDEMIFLGNITSGNIPYTRIKCFEADYINSLIVTATDFTKTYTLNKGFTAIGGTHTFYSYGSWQIYRDSTSRMWIVDTGASLSEYIGGDVEAPDTSPVIYDYLDRQFVPYPFAREGIRAELSNISKTTKITLPETQDNLIRGMLAAGTDFRGSRCILRRVFPDHIDEPGADIVLLDGYIQDWSYVPGKQGIAFSVSKTLIDVGAQFPKRLMNMGCSHVFKGSRCRYLGEEGRCLKTRAFCTSLGNLNQFGGFPWVAARQRRVMWK